MPHPRPLLASSSARSDAPSAASHPLARRRARSSAARVAAGGLAGAGLLCWAGTVRAEASAEAAAKSPVQLRADFGFLGVLQHDYQQGDPGSSFDFHDEGGQDVLFPVSRY